MLSHKRERNLSFHSLSTAWFSSLLTPSLSRKYATHLFRSPATAPDVSFAPTRLRTIFFASRHPLQHRIARISSRSITTSFANGLSPAVELSFCYELRSVYCTSLKAEHTLGRAPLGRFLRNREGAHATRRVTSKAILEVFRYVNRLHVFTSSCCR